MKYINKWYFEFKRYCFNRYPTIYAICNGRKSSIKFFFAGVTAAMTNLLLLLIFHGWLGWGLVFSTSLAFILSFGVSFTLQKFWAFRNYHYKKIPVQLSLYLVNAFIGLNLNALLMHIFVNNMEVWYLLAQAGVSMMIGLYNYLVYNFIIFKKTRA